MNEVPGSIKAPSEPQVNLLPPEVEARRARGRQRSAIVLVFVAFLAALGFGVYWAWSQNAAAQEELQRVIDEGILLDNQIAAYDPVVATMSELANAQNVRTYVGSTEIDFTRIIEDMNAALPSGVIIDEMSWDTVSVTNPVNVTVDQDLSLVPDLGTVSIRGRLPYYVTSAELEEALNSVLGFERARIPSAQRQDTEEGERSQYTFDGTVHINAWALTGRFGANWNETYTVTQAVNIVDRRLLEAEAAVEAADKAHDAGVPGASEELAEAKAVRDTAVQDEALVNALTQEVTDATNRALLLTTAVTYEMAGASADLAEVQAELEEMWPVLKDLALAVRAWDEEATTLATIEDRIQAAEDYVDFCQDRVDDAQEAVDEREDGASEALERAQVDLAFAQYTLRIEESGLEAAQNAEEAARAALEEVLVEVADLLGLDYVAGGGTT